ncbi:unnamed protein product [Heterobilharzia americana]|nr:unnamed protein product [Heterobilharzia americana]
MHMASKDPIRCETSEEEMNQLTGAERHLIKADSDTLNEIYERKRQLAINHLIDPRNQHSNIGVDAIPVGGKSCINYAYNNELES